MTSPHLPGSARARVATYLVVGALAIATLTLDLPPVRTPPPLRALSSIRSDSQPAWTQYVDTLERGETLSDLLARGGVTGSAAAAALEAATSLDERRVPVGMPVTVRNRTSDSVPSEIILQLAVDRLLYLRRAGTEWTSEEVRLPWTADTIVVSGVIRSNLYDALDSSAASLPAGTRAELAWTLADIFEYRVDMSRELQVEDEFRALFVRSTGPAGAVRVGDVLAARFVLSGESIEAIRFSSATARGNYFDQHGKSMRAAFLRAPLAFRRISSAFGMRKHPILGVWRQHQGLDYAAVSGTPVRSVGDGAVIFSGRKGGYGQVVEVRHRNGYVTRYGHLRGFGASVRRGARVGIGQTIGYVGMTGLATAPHLHFEVLVNGAHRNPRVALTRKGGDPIPRSERASFDSVRSALIASLDGQEPLFRVVSR